MGYVDGAVRVTHRSERVEQVVERPGNDDDVVDVEPEGQHNGGYSNTWERRRSSSSVKFEIPDLPFTCSWKRVPRRCIRLGSVRWITLRVLSKLEVILYVGSSYLSSWAWASTLRGLPLMWTVPETFPGKREVSQQTPGSRNTGSGKPLNTVENIIWIENRGRKTLVTMSHCSPLAFNEKCNLIILFKIMQGAPGGDNVLLRALMQ